MVVKYLILQLDFNFSIQCSSNKEVKLFQDDGNI